MNTSYQKTPKDLKVKVMKDTGMVANLVANWDDRLAFYKADADAKEAYVPQLDQVLRCRLGLKFDDSPLGIFDEYTSLDGIFVIRRSYRNQNLSVEINSGHWPDRDYVQSILYTGKDEWELLVNTDQITELQIVVENGQASFYHRDDLLSVTLTERTIEQIKESHAQLKEYLTILPPLPDLEPIEPAEKLQDPVQHFFDWADTLGFKIVDKGTTSRGNPYVDLHEVNSNNHVYARRIQINLPTKSKPVFDTRQQRVGYVGQYCESAGHITERFFSKTQRIGRWSKVSDGLKDLERRLKKRKFLTS